MAMGITGCLFTIVLVSLFKQNCAREIHIQSTSPEFDISNFSNGNKSIGLSQLVLWQMCGINTPISTQKANKNLHSVHKVNVDRLLLSISLLLCGDIHPCPGPAKCTPRYPCVVCYKGVRSNSRAINCDICGEWTHIACAGITKATYDNVGDGSIDFTCDKCSINNLPFAHDFHLDVEDPPTAETRKEEEKEDTNSIKNNDFELFKKRGLHFIHFNARSVIPKLSELRFFAKNTTPSVISITESWLDHTVNDSEIEIENYVVVRKDRNRSGGGVCMFIHKDLSFNVRNDLEHKHLESIWVDLILPKSKPILIGTCYRPPDQRDFYSFLQESCDTISIEQECIVLGDFNTDVSSKSVKNHLMKSLKSLCYTLNLKQIIEQNTRITSSSKSTIDLIFVSDKGNISQSGVLNSCISDHQAIYCTRKSTKDFVGKHSTIKIRSMKNYSKDAYNEKLSKADWFSVLNCDDVDSAWGKFKKIFLEVLDSIAPEKVIRTKQRTEPWFDGDVLHHIQLKEQALLQFRKSGLDNDYQSFKKVRNKCQVVIKKAKSSYYKDKLEENKNNSKELWSTLKELGTSKTLKTKSSNIGLTVGDTISFDCKQVANIFNNFFTTVASKLVEKLPPMPNKYSIGHIRSYYNSKGVSPNDFKLEVVGEDTVSRIIQKLGVNKATGIDKIPARFIKDGSEQLVGPITHICNLSIFEQKIPDDLKTAKVVPIYKKGNKNEPGNYRPVSVLTVVSKVLERVVYNQTNDFLKSKNLVYDLQSGFRESYSTDSCLIYLTDYIRLQSDQGNYTGMAMLDLQKAFDTVAHNILLTKLQAMGMDNNSVNWFKSYLCGR